MAAVTPSKLEGKDVKTFAVNDFIDLPFGGTGGSYANLAALKTAWAIPSLPIALTSDVSGTLPVGNGGTGLTTLSAAGRLLYSSSASAMAALAIGSSSQILTVVSGLPSWQTLSVNLTTQVSGILPIANGGTAASTASAARANLGAADASHNHSAADITSGTLATARGGTNLSTFTGAGRIPYSTSSSVLAMLAPGTDYDALTLSSSGLPIWTTGLRSIICARAVHLSASANICNWSNDAGNIINKGGFTTSTQGIQVPSAGVYLILAYVRTTVSVGAGVTRWAGITLNGVQDVRWDQEQTNMSAASNMGLSMNVIASLDLSAGDIIRVYTSNTTVKSDDGVFIVMRVGYDGA